MAENNRESAPDDDSYAQEMDANTTAMDGYARHRTRRLWSAMLALTALVFAVLTLTLIYAPAASAGGCRNANLSPETRSEAKRAEKATRCLINRERRRHGARSARYNKRLLKSARWQAKDMIRHEYFDHGRSGGPSFVGRMTRFGYGKKSSGYSLGENLAWATSSIATPREMVRMWMKSPGHRKNLLKKKFKEQAVSAVYSDGDVGGDYYDSDGPFVVYVSHFGTRY